MHWKFWILAACVASIAGILTLVVHPGSVIIYAPLVCDLLIILCLEIFRWPVRAYFEQNP